MQVSIMQVDYEALMFWLTLTLLTSIALALLYRAVVRSIHGGVKEEAQQVGGGPPAKFLFISAEVDEANDLLKRAKEDIDEGRFSQAVEKSVAATINILSQLLKYFSIDAKGMSVDEMMRSLGRNGVRLHTPHVLDRMNKTIENARSGRPLAREEAVWMVSAAGLIVGASKEARVVESSV